MKKNLAETRRENGKKGGLASANKRRNMKGVCPGRGSAGRVNAGYKKRRAQERVRGDKFLDVASACAEWLRAQGEKVCGFREMMLGDIHETRMKKS